MAKIEIIIKDEAGEKLLSDQKIWDIVVNKAVEISNKWQSEIEEIKQEIPIAPTVDIYDPLTEEILLFDDGIGVKQQKLDELITYITKHESEIINYELRRQTGKTIGSGRMEKRVDERDWSSPKTQRYELEFSRK